MKIRRTKRALSKLDLDENFPAAPTKISSENNLRKQLEKTKKFTEKMTQKKKMPPIFVQSNLQQDKRIKSNLLKLHSSDQSVFRDVF